MGEKQCDMVGKIIKINSGAFDDYYVIIGYSEKGISDYLQNLEVLYYSQQYTDKLGKDKMKTIPKIVIPLCRMAYFDEVYYTHCKETFMSIPQGESSIISFVNVEEIDFIDRNLVEEYWDKSVRDTEYVKEKLEQRKQKWHIEQVEKLEKNRLYLLGNELVVYQRSLSNGKHLIYSIAYFWDKYELDGMLSDVKNYIGSMNIGSIEKFFVVDEPRYVEKDTKFYITNTLKKYKLDMTLFRKG